MITPQKKYEDGKIRFNINLDSKINLFDVVASKVICPLCSNLIIADFIAICFYQKKGGTKEQQRMDFHVSISSCATERALKKADFF